MVEKIAFLFPGQGSQFIGMGKEAASQSSTASDLVKKADEKLGFSLSQIMFEGPEDKLKETQITQPALFVASAVALELLKEKGIEPSWVAGHSLGEYSALYAAGVISFEDTVYLVHERGKAMQEAGKANPGTMAAILGLDENKVTEICNQVNQEVGICSPANFNSETQIVISGTKEAVPKAMEKAKEAGALKVVPLNVSGAFHSALMSPAAESLKSKIKQISFQKAKIPVITNVDAAPTTEPQDFQEKLVQQINQSVQWNKTMKQLLSLGGETFVEVGSGRVLATLMKKADRKKASFWTDDFEAINKKWSIPSPQAS